MKLSLKPNANYIPSDIYGIPCIDAYAYATKTIVDNENKVLTIEYAIYRNKAEAEAKAPPLMRGAYVWTKNVVESQYTEAVPAELDEDGKEVTPAIDPVLIRPRFGAFDTLFANINIDDKGNTNFGDVGKTWIMLAIDPYGNKWADNWNLDN